MKHSGGNVISWWFYPFSHLLVVTTRLFWFLVHYHLQVCVIKFNIKTVLHFSTSYHLISFTHSLLWEGRLLGDIPVDVWECSFKCQCISHVHTCTCTHTQIHTSKKIRAWICCMYTEVSRLVVHNSFTLIYNFILPRTLKRLYCMYMCTYTLRI